MFDFVDPTRTRRGVIDRGSELRLNELKGHTSHLSNAEKFATQVFALALVSLVGSNLQDVAPSVAPKGPVVYRFLPKVFKGFGSPDGTRTSDPAVNSVYLDPRMAWHTGASAIKARTFSAKKAYTAHHRIASVSTKAQPKSCPPGCPTTIARSQTSLSQTPVKLYAIQRGHGDAA